MLIPRLSRCSLLLPTLTAAITPVAALASNAQISGASELITGGAVFIGVIADSIGTA